METEERPVKRKRKKYRQDGSMRPTAVRYQKARERKLRVAWLAEFEPGARAEFFEAVNMDEALFASPYAREHGITKPEAEEVLADLAATREWLSLVTKSGRTVGIGPRK